MVWGVYSYVMHGRNRRRGGGIGHDAKRTESGLFLCCSAITALEVHPLFEDKLLGFRVGLFLHCCHVFGIKCLEIGWDHVSQLLWG